MINLFPKIAIVEDEQKMQLLTIGLGSKRLLCSELHKELPDLQSAVWDEPVRLESKLGTMERIELPVSWATPLRQALNRFRIPYNYHNARVQRGALQCSDVRPQFAPFIQALGNRTGGVVVLKEYGNVHHFLMVLFRHFVERSTNPHRSMLVYCHGRKDILISNLRCICPDYCRVYTSPGHADKRGPYIVVASPEQFPEWAIEHGPWDQIVVWGKAKISPEAHAVLAWRGHRFCFRLFLESEVNAPALQRFLNSPCPRIDLRRMVPVSTASISKLLKHREQRTHVKAPPFKELEDGYMDTARRDLAVSELALLIQQCDLQHLQECGVAMNPCLAAKIKAGASVAIMAGSEEHAASLRKILPSWDSPDIPSETAVGRSNRRHLWLMKKAGKKPADLGDDIYKIYPQYWEVGDQCLVTEGMSLRLATDVLIRASGQARGDVLKRGEHLTCQLHSSQLVIDVM